MSGNPLLKTPGELINEARLAQDLTLAQLSDRTKIPPPVLTALELDEYHKISGPLYIKSFLRTCALDLGLDPETVLSLYSKISGEKKSAAPGSEMVWEDDQVTVSHVGLPWVRIIMIAGIAVTLVGVGLFAMRGCGREHEPPAAVENSAVDPASSGDQSAVAVADDLQQEESSDHESMMAAETEADLEKRPAISPEPPRGGAEAGKTKPSPNDTLALGWLESTPPVVDKREIVPETVPEEEAPVQADTVVSTPAESEVESPMVVAAPVQKQGIQTPIPEPVYVETVDSAWPLVLRIVCDSPQDILVKRDGEGTAKPVRWPAGQENGPAVPEAGFEAGRAYRQNGKLVVFWGAEDHFSLTLARVRGVEVSINGRVRDTGRLRSGQEIILDAHSVGSAERR